MAVGIQLNSIKRAPEMSTNATDLKRLTFNLVSLIATPIALYYAASWLFGSLDPLKSRNDAAKKLSAKALQRLQKSVKDASIRLKDITEHETVIMSEVITPEELNIKFDGTMQLVTFALTIRYWGPGRYYLQCQGDCDISSCISGSISFCFVSPYVVYLMVVG
jgi:hypothetical protein